MLGKIIGGLTVVAAVSGLVWVFMGQDKLTQLTKSLISKAGDYTDLLKDKFGDIMKKAGDRVGFQYAAN